MSNPPQNMALSDAIRERLISDYGFTPKSTGAGERLTAGRCPSCGKPEAYTPPDNPRVIICPRMNHCGERFTARNLFPDLYSQFAERHPPTQDNPTATADALLEARGINPAPIRDWYGQGSVTITIDKGKRKFSTIAFPLPGCEAVNNRIIDYTGRDKTRTFGEYSGRAWTPPKFKPEGEIWLTEAILCALSLNQIGKKAVSCLSVGHVPRHWLATVAKRNITLIIALDNDEAGLREIPKHIAACKELNIRYRVALPPERLDWNDLLARGQLDDTALETALWQGQLFSAESAEQYYALFSEKRRDHLFEFKGEIYVVNFKDGERSFVRISDFTAQRIYRLKRELSSRIIEYSEVLHIRRRDGETHDVEISGAVLAKPTALREHLLAHASVQWDGAAPDLNKFLRQIRRRRVPHVREVGAWGYDRKSDSYFYPAGAIDPDGKFHGLEKDGFIRIGPESYRLPDIPEDEETQWLTPEAGMDFAELISLLQRAYPSLAALLALGFYVSALFADQIARGANGTTGTGFFPFLSLYGDPGTGKTTLLEFLNRMFGRDWEGTPVADGSTKVGMSRILTQNSNMVHPLVEADAHANNLVEELVNLRTLYNRGTIRVTGVKSHDNRTNSPAFRAALAFGWNEEKLTDLKVISRMISLPFKRADVTVDTRAAFIALENSPHNQLAAFGRWILTNRRAVLAAIQAHYPGYTSGLTAGGVAMERVAKNHALALAGIRVVLDALVDANSLESGIRDDIEERLFKYALDAAQRKERVMATDPQDIQFFLEQVNGLLADGSIENMSKKAEFVALSMPEIEQEMNKKQMRFRVNLENLRSSVFCEKSNYPQQSTKQNKQVKCWIFRAEAFGRHSHQQGMDL